MGRPVKHLTDSAQKLAKKQRQRKWAEGRITIGAELLERWNTVKCAVDLKTDRDVAEFLLDWYDKTATLTPCSPNERKLSVCHDDIDTKHPSGIFPIETTLLKQIQGTITKAGRWVMPRPSPVAVMSAPKDDPMDLGPFLKEYVLNNPFTPTSSPPPPRQVAPPRPLPVVAVKSRPLLAPSPPRMGTRSGSNSPTMAPPPPTTMTISQIPVLAVKAIPSPIVHQVAPIVHHAAPIVHHAPFLQTALRPTPINVQGSLSSSPPLPVGATLAAAVVDTPKAHIGSNRNFAVMLREMKLPHKHIKVKKWLLAHYRHVATSPVWLSSDDLLDHAHHLFADLKSNVLSRIMKVTFPNCHKVINKYGYFYIGLVRRPQKQHYADELLRMAADAVASGRVTVELAAQTHGVSSELVNRLVVWMDAANDPAPDEEQDTEDSDPDWVMTETDSDSDNQGAATRDSSPPRTNLKWKLRQKARSRLLTKMKRTSESGRTSSPDWQPRSAGRSHPYPARRTSSRRTRSTGDKTEEVWVKQEVEDDYEDHEEEGCESEGEDDTRMDYEDMSSDNPQLPVVSAIGSVQVKVKAEPVDTDYDQYEANNNNTISPKHPSPDPSTKQSFNTLRHLLNGNSDQGTSIKQRPESPVSESGKTEQAHEENSLTASTTANGASSSSAANRTQSLNTVVDLLTMKQELQQTREDLAEKVNENTQLEAKLSHAHSEVEKLQRTVSTQETQLLDLATEFFELSNRFMKMTHKFKQALTDAKVKQDHRT